MPIILDKKLYALARQKADAVYKKSSAYKSGYIIKVYKELGGRYKDDNKQKKLTRWFKEEWKDIGNSAQVLQSQHAGGPYASKDARAHKNYPVYRPTIRINKGTPLTYDEIDKKQLKKQIKLKQEIKGDKNLPRFKSK